MKVALIGASGFVGSAILNELVGRGHQVTAIVRSPERVKQHPLVTAIKANAHDENQVAEAVKGNDVVVNAFNPGWTNPNIYEEALQGAKAIQQGVKKSGVKRLFVIGGAGSLYIAPGLQLIDSPQFPAEYKAGASAARDYLEIIKKEPELEWTFLSPAIEVNPGAGKGAYRKGLEDPVYTDEGRSIISVEDIAVAIVDELENPKHIRQRFTVGD